MHPLAPSLSALGYFKVGVSMHTDGHQCYGHGPAWMDLDAWQVLFGTSLDIVTLAYRKGPFTN